MGLFEDVKAVFDQFGIPAHIWAPIAYQESGFNPAALNDNGEYSVGLFQINLNAHPDLNGYNLTDPVTNARIAAERFIRPAYEQIKWNPDPGIQAAYVWQNGIRPNWSSVQSRGADVKLMQDARTIATGGTNPELPAEPNPNRPGWMPDWLWNLFPEWAQDPYDPETGVDPGYHDYLRNLEKSGNILLWITFGVVLLVLFGGGFWALAKAFGADSYIKSGAKSAAGLLGKVV